MIGKILRYLMSSCIQAVRLKVIVTDYGQLQWNVWIWINRFVIWISCTKYETSYTTKSLFLIQLELPILKPCMNMPCTFFRSISPTCFGVLGRLRKILRADNRLTFKKYIFSNLAIFRKQDVYKEAKDTQKIGHTPTAHNKVLFLYKASLISHRFIYDRFDLIQISILAGPN